MLLIGRFGYNVPFPHNLAAFVVALVVGAASFTALGLGMSTLIPNQEAGAPITSVVFFVLLFLSGLWFPLRRNSGLAKFSSYLPVRHLILSVYDAVHRSEGRVELAVARHLGDGDLGCRWRCWWRCGAGAGRRARPSVANHGVSRASACWVDAVPDESRGAANVARFDSPSG